MAETTQRAMIPQDLTRIRFISDPQVSPDGQRVAFVVTTLSEEQDEYLANIWLVDTAGGAPRRFTTGPGRDTTPRWSPEGARLAFVSVWGMHLILWLNQITIFANLELISELDYV